MPSTTGKVERLQALEEEMAQANAEYIQAVNRASKLRRYCFDASHGVETSRSPESLHAQVCEVLRNMLDEPDIVRDEAG